MFCQPTTLDLRLDYPVDHQYKLKIIKVQVWSLKELLLGHLLKRSNAHLKPRLCFYHLGSLYEMQQLARYSISL